MSGARVAVIGLDGCSPKYLEKLIRYGFIPTIKNIVARHGYYKLYAFPPCTPPSWSSIMTGVNPGKHGIFGFQHYDKEKKMTYLTNTLHLEHPRVHEMLGMNGVPSIVINPIPSYPLIPVKNTIQISHMFFTPRLTWYPEDIGKYAKILGEHSYNSETREEFLESVSYGLDKYIELVETLADKVDWRLFWINLHYPDAILHQFDEEWVFYKQYYKEKEIFGKIDRIVKTLADLSDHVIIVSDHGFAHYHTIININSYLYSKGFAAKTSSGKGLKEFWEHQEKREYLAVKNKVLLRLANTRILGNALRKTKKFFERITGKRIKAAEYDVDTSKSRAFLLSTYSHGIILNDPTIKKDIVRALNEIEGLREIIDATKIFTGNYVDRGPDLLVMPDYDKGYMLGKNKISSYVIRRRETNNHHPIGILVVSGISNKDIDIVPNHIVSNVVLSFLDQPLPNDADDVGLAEKITGKHVGIKNYNSGWRLLKKLVLLKR
ncbi:MAG: hypothetical protein GXO43_01770 [Crenarchaeota archaeon]|nr:hypothetical protein [Thermoproteota archaeon]